jgi:hypothetical protein
LTSDVLEPAATCPTCTGTAETVADVNSSLSSHVDLDVGDARVSTFHSGTFPMERINWQGDRIGRVDWNGLGQTRWKWAESDTEP